MMLGDALQVFCKLIVHVCACVRTCVHTYVCMCVSVRSMHMY